MRLISKILIFDLRYTLIKDENLVGIGVFCYAKEKLASFITNIEADIVKTGMMGTVGNKGSCYIRISYKDTNIAVGCAHLAAGQKHHKQRIEELVDIINKPLRNPVTKEVFYVF